jgi:hypothetical protein
MRPPVLDDESTLNDESTKEKKSFWSEPQSIPVHSRPVAKSKGDR